MAKTKNMTQRKLFVDAYLRNSCDAKMSAAEIGVGKTIVYEWLREPQVQEMLNARISEVTISPTQYLGALAQQFNSSIADFIDPVTNAIDPAKILDPELRHCIDTYTETHLKGGGIERKLKLMKQMSQTQLGNILKMIKPDTTVNVNINNLGLTEEQIDAKLSQLYK